MRSDALETGVFLDFATVDSGDLDIACLQRALPDWRWHAFTPPGEIVDRIAGADVVLANKCVLDRTVLQQAPRLKLVALAATGTDNVDLGAARELGIAVCNIRDYATDSVAQHTITLMLNLLTGLPWYWQKVRAGEWSEAMQFCLNDLPIREARGLSFGVIGYGVLGRAAGGLAQGLGMELIIAERRGRKARPGRLPFGEAVARADVLSIHCPLTDQTRSLIDRAVLRAMKRSALLLNTARGGIVVEADLADALRAGEIAGAGVDTLGQEPPPPDHVLLAPDIPNLIVTPHNAWASRDARQAAVDQLARIVEAYQSGRPFNVVNRG